MAVLRPRPPRRRSPAASVTPRLCCGRACSDSAPLRPRHQLYLSQASFAPFPTKPCRAINDAQAVLRPHLLQRQFLAAAITARLGCGRACSNATPSTALTTPPPCSGRARSDADPSRHQSCLGRAAAVPSLTPLRRDDDNARGRSAAAPTPTQISCSVNHALAKSADAQTQTPLHCRVNDAPTMFRPCPPTIT